MRRVILFMAVTLDGFFEGANGDIGWHNVDEEFNEFASDQLDSVDVLLFGRVTYEMMASYWPTPAAIADDPVIANKMNAMPKVVFSKTLKKAEWNNTRLLRDGMEIVRLKQQPGKDLIIFGSSGLAASLATLGLIDEYRMMVNPVVLGNGRTVLNGIAGRLNLKLVRTRVFGSGNVLLSYQPDREG